ncbi:MAG: chromate transporter [Anaerolineales bacterium]|nr:chromate transporter [Anaerolineales bacterium]
MNTSVVKVWLKLFWMFLKVNILTTSGPASVGLLYKEAVGSIMTEGQFVEAVGFSNVLPGSEALKLAMFVGYAAAGIPGTIVALFSSIIPPTVIMLTVVSVVNQFQEQGWMDGFIKGLGPAVAMLMVVVAWQIFRSDNSKPIKTKSMFIAMLSLVAFMIDIPSPFVLVGAGILGVLLFKWTKNKFTF